MGHPQVAAFARLANDEAQPTREIAGQNTLFTRTMHDMAYDPIHDEIIVPQFFAFAILTFSGDADGDVAPIRTIMGPSTQLKNTHAVAVDPVHDEIYVPGRHGDNRILVFPREADGDVAPMRILELDKTPGRVAVDPVRNLLVVSGGPQLHIYDRTASGRAQPRGVISVPQDVGRRGTGLMAINSENGMIFVKISGGDRHDALDYVGVWSVYDDGEVPPRFTIGGPNGVLKDGRGVALDIEHQNVIVTDKTLNAVLTFHVPEAFEVQ